MTSLYSKRHQDGLAVPRATVTSGGGVTGHQLTWRAVSDAMGHRVAPRAGGTTARGRCLRQLQSVPLSRRGGQDDGVGVRHIEHLRKKAFLKILKQIKCIPLPTLGVNTLDN